MVSLKTSLVVAAAGLLQKTTARQCTARMSGQANSPIGGSAQHQEKLQVWFNDNPDEILDEQESGPSPGQMKHLDTYDGVQTLTSQALGGDVRLWATREESPSKGLTRHIGSCSWEYINQKDTQGTVMSDGWYCEIVFEC